MDEITVITNHIQEEAGDLTDLNWGHCYDENLGENIMVTIIATGFEGRRDKKEEPKKVLNLDETVPEPPVVQSSSNANRPAVDPKPAVDKSFVQTNLWSPQDRQSTEPVLKQTFTSVAKSDNDDLEDENYASQPRQQYRESEENKLQRIRGYSETIKTNKGLDDVEREPAYRRKKIKLSNVPHSSESNISRYTLTEDEEDNPQIKQKNPYLHDNID